MYAVYETETHLFLCLELLTGGELFDRIISKVSSSRHTTESTLVACTTHRLPAYSCFCLLR